MAKGDGQPKSREQAESAPAWPSRGYAWYVVLILVLALALAILDRTIISLIVEPLRADLRISDMQVGLLQGLAFAICYASFGLLLGWATDRTRRCTLLAGGIFVWSLSTMACGLANSFAALFAARVGVGLGEAAIMPVAASLIADYFPASRRATAFGVFHLGGSLAIGAGNFLGGTVVELAGAIRSWAPLLLGAMHDWQIIFLAVGAPGVLLALWFYLTVREPVRREQVRDGGSGRALAAHLKAHARANALLIGGAVLTYTTFAATSAWLASVFIRVHGWTPFEVGATMAMLSPLGMSSSLTVGWVISALERRGRSDAPLLTAAAQALVQAGFGTMLCLTPSPQVALVGYGAMLLVANWTAASALTALSQITPNELRGQMVALYGFLTGIISLTIGSWAVGYLSDRVFAGTGGIGPSLATVLFGFGVPGAVLLLAGRPAYRAAIRHAGFWRSDTLPAGQGKQ